ncbi:MAG: hypothetical protein K0U29_08790 [Gammaproteobacteria bacterium]|nr:hypothetical protein [Gammaproteobacteria bacterium]
MILKRFLVILCWAAAFFAVIACADSFIIKNNTDQTFTRIMVADPSVHPVSKQILPHASLTIQLQEQPKFSIKLTTMAGDVLSIVYVQGFLSPRCIAGNFNCSDLSLSGVTINP